MGCCQSLHILRILIHLHLHECYSLYVEHHSHLPPLLCILLETFFSDAPPPTCCAQLCVTLCNCMDCQAPLSMKFPRQEYQTGLSFLPPGDLPDPGIEPGSPPLQAGSLPSEPPGKPLVMLGRVKYHLCFYITLHLGL